MTMYSSPNNTASSFLNNSSITELLSALCDRSLSGVSWKRRALGGISKEGFHRALKKRAYGTLLSKLFQDAAKQPVSARSSVSVTPPRNKILMICFDLRVAGCREEAERLEAQLEMLPGEGSSGLKEVDAVLDLLVYLAGSTPPPSVSFNKDYMRRERPVLRKPQPWDYQSEELQRLEARSWGLVCGEEWGSLYCGYRIQRLMDASPGTGLLALKTKLDVEERFERETRLTLFGALQHTRTSDMDIRLDLPPVPSNIDVTGLAIRVPSSLDQSEDEGFQSASNLTPDSQSEASPLPDVDIWDALRTFEPAKRRCWESIGCPPGKQESLYLTEGGREAFDQLYRLWEGQMKVVSSSTPSPLLPLPQDSQGQLVSHLLNMLIGVASTSYPLNQSVQFDVRPGMCISGASPESVSRLLGELAQYGTHYLRLSHFSLQSADKKGLVFQAFTGGLRKYLHYYRACVLSTPPTLSLLTISFLFRKVGRQLRYLSELCCVDGPLGAGQAAFPVGVKLLSYLYNEAQNNCSNENYPVLLSLLKSSCEPYTRFVSDWVYSGVFRDVYKEFMIQVNEEYLSCRDKHFWVQGYTLISKDVEDCVPIFLRYIANDVYVCGKTINLLKICCPQHYICWSELPVPRIAVTFSLQEVEEIERDCAVYRGRLERIAKHSALSREEQAQRVEQARQELISQVTESAAKTLETIRGRQVSLRLAEEAKKRERFEELKQHLEQEQEWRSTAKKRQEEDDFSFARELRDREKRLQALEEQLEQRARKELMAQYSRLSEEAARRERRAMWRAQRSKLDDARAQFFTRDKQQTQAMLENKPADQQGPPGEVLPSVPSTQQTAPRPAQESRDGQSTEEKEGQSGSGSLPPPTNTALLSEVLWVTDSPLASRNSEGHQAEETSFEIPSVPPLDYDFSAPFSPLEGMTGPAKPKQDEASHWRPAVCWPPPVHYQLPAAFGSSAGSAQPLASAHGEVAVSDNLKSEPAGVSSDSEFVQEGDTRAGAEPLVEAATSDRGICVAPVTEENVSAIVQHAAPLKPPPSHSQLNTGATLLSGSVRSHPSDSTPKLDAPPPPPQNVHGHASDSHIRVGEHVPDVAPPLPTASVHGHPSDSQIGVGGHLQKLAALPLPHQNVHGHPSDSHIRVDGHMLKLDPPPLPYQNLHGHASDSHIRLGEHVPDVAPPLPAPNVHGHASDSHIRLGEHVPDVAPPLPAASVHGHASDSHIRVGEHVPDVAPPLPTASVHGHPSDSHIGVGGHLQKLAAPPLPHQNVHGHASDAHIRVGEFVWEEQLGGQPRWSRHGHASDSTLRPGCIVSGSDPAPSATPTSTRGHSSDSTLSVGCVVSRAEAPRSPLPCSVYGHASHSSLGMGCVVKGKSSGNEQLTKELKSQDDKGDHPLVGVLYPSGAGFCPSPGEKSEQEYLAALSAHYKVEHYEDCYTLSAVSPESQLLKQVTRGPWGLPAEQSLRRATDTTAVQLSQMVSLPVLMKHSVTMPLVTHVSLVNKAVVDYFFVELGVEGHFEALRHFLLMEDGEFAQSLSDLLFEKLGSGQTPGELLTPLVLNSILTKALEYSLHGDTHLAGNFTFALRYLPETFHPHAPDSLNCLELRYKVDWPLNIIITDSCMNKYNRLFSFLLQLKHMVWSLREVWFHLKRTALVKGAGRSVQFRQLQLYRHEMQHFVKVIQGYIANQILQVSWSEFTAKLATASDLDAIHRLHADYLNRAIFRSLLTEKAAPVMNIIHSIFSLILKFRAQLIAQPWDSQQGEAVHPSFIAMQQSYNTFKYYSHFLFKVVTKLVNRGYQPHLEDFLLRINFNNYYKDS